MRWRWIREGGRQEEENGRDDGRVIGGDGHQACSVGRSACLLSDPGRWPLDAGARPLLDSWILYSGARAGEWRGAARLVSRLQLY